MVSGAVARPSASSPAGSARRTVGAESAAADAASPRLAEPARASAAASTPRVAEALMRPLIILRLLIALNGALQVIGLAHRLRGRHFRRAESARARGGSDRWAALVARGVQCGLGLGIDVVLLLNRHRPEARLVH